jgi:hypothetical protein
MGHEPVRGGAVPVLLAWSGVDGVAGSGFDDAAVAAAEQGGAVDDEQGLALAVGMPVRTGSGRDRTRLRRARSACGPAWIRSIHTSPVNVSAGPLAVGGGVKISMASDCLLAAWAQRRLSGYSSVIFLSWAIAVIAFGQPA